jgi:hypothetical protein
MEIGQHVWVRCRFDGRWTSGFAIAEHSDHDDAFVVKRLSDGTVLPEAFGPDEVRPDDR